ncbi:MAG: tetratricopeptide repeat protein, partial [Nitrospirota bacterium]
MTRRALFWLCMFVAGAIASLTFDIAVSQAFPVIDITPEQIQVLPGQKSLAEALALLNHGRYDAAIKKVREVLKDDPGSAPAQEILGAALVMKGQVDEGLKALKRAVELDPSADSAITKIGDIYMAQGQQKKAKEKFLQAIKINPQNRRAHQRLGLIYEDEGKYQQAVEHYGKGIRGTPPEYVGVKVNLGRLYNLSRMYEKTIALLEGLINRDKGGATAHIVLCSAYLNTDRVNE